MTINRTNLTWSENNRVNRLLRRARRDTVAWSLIRSIELCATIREISEAIRTINKQLSEELDDFAKAVAARV